MKYLALLFMIFIVMGCSKSEFEVAQLASSDQDHVGEEPVGLPDDIPETPEVLHTTPPADSGDFSFGKTTIKLANGPAQIWNGCDTSSSVVGGYNSDTVCGKGYFHPLFAEHLNKHFYQCVEQASQKANIPAPERVFIRHLGTYANRNGRGSSSLSMHAYARAIDIAQFNLYDRFGQVTKVSNEMQNYRGATAAFYDSFRECWKDSMPSACKPGQKEFNGSIGHPKSALGGNNLHTKHIHLSFPFCAE
jgi:hypothetical protein